VDLGAPGSGLALLGRDKPCPYHARLSIADRRGRACGGRFWILDFGFWIGRPAGAGLAPPAFCMGCRAGTSPAPTRLL